MIFRIVHSRLQRPEGASGDAARARDRERCAEFADDLEQVGEQVTASGTNVTVRMNRDMPVAQESKRVDPRHEISKPGEKARKLK